MLNCLNATFLQTSHSLYIQHLSYQSTKLLSWPDHWLPSLELLPSLCMEITSCRHFQLPSVYDLQIELPLLICTNISFSIMTAITQGEIGLEMHMSTKKPASLMHFTTLAPGKAALNLSQWRIEDKPPAEQPPSRACTQKRQGNQSV